MKNIRNLLLLLSLTVLLSSCYKEEFFVDENATSQGFIPVIQLLTLTNFTAGSTGTVTVQYWSKDPVKELQLYADGILVSSTPYTYSYDATAKAEIMKLSYAVPAGSAGQKITIKVAVVNENGLKREKSATVTVK